ncbi:Long-chain acyl-CoA synthetase [Trichostrongylus colubriformis]|uniref:long-chain-fatty-acid--CoA ligase n=1 Tax=Trichostrongylus colubriformis TaxID=6319 RepID=A0AAN8FFB6_TRICO
MIRSRLPKLEVPGLPFHEYFFKSTRKYADNLAMLNYDTKEQFTFNDLITKAKFIGRALGSESMIKPICSDRGKPKGVQLSHRSLLAAVAGLYVQWVPPPNRFYFGCSDVYFSFLSLAHIYEHLMQTFIIYVGGRIGIYSGDVSRLLSDIQTLRPTIVSLVPRLLNKFHDHIHAQISKKNVLIRKLFAHAKEVKLKMLHDGVQRYDTVWDKLVFKKIHDQFGGRLRMLTTGGAPVIPAIMDFTRIAYGCPLMEGYGQTECAAAGTLNLPFDGSTGHVGGPAPWSQIKLVDVPEMNYFAVHDKGEVCFRGAGVMAGYFMDEELSRKTVDEEGWLHTGDIGEWQSNGALKIIDRKNALFKLAQGDFVSPEQIEAVYLNSPLLEQIFITGMTTRSFLVGVAVMNMAILRTALAGRSELAKYIHLSDGELLSETDVRQFVLKELNQTAKAKNLLSIELIKDVHLTSEEFTAENGLVTPTLKLRRHLLKQRFEKEIEKMYTEISAL